ncbi:hypothetical protein [Comamonas sp.]
MMKSFSAPAAWMERHGKQRQAEKMVNQLERSSVFSAGMGLAAAL